MDENNNIFQRGQPIEKAKKALILLHGRGGSANDILSLAEYFCDDSFYIVAPQAPGNTWYPNSFNDEEKLNEPKLSQSIEIIKNVINKTSKHIPKSQIYLMGFSQGASLSLEISSRDATKYGGIVAFSGALIGSKTDPNKYKGNFDRTKVFIGISERDPFIPLIRAQEAKELMKQLGADVTLKVYPGSSHTINEDEINWVKEQLFS